MSQTHSFSNAKTTQPRKKKEERRKNKIDLVYLHQNAHCALRKGKDSHLTLRKAQHFVPYHPRPEANESVEVRGSRIKWESTHPNMEFCWLMHPNTYDGFCSGCYWERRKFH